MDGFSNRFGDPKRRPQRWRERDAAEARDRLPREVAADPFSPNTRVRNPLSGDPLNIAKRVARERQSDADRASEPAPAAGASAAPARSKAPLSPSFKSLLGKTRRRDRAEAQERRAARSASFPVLVIGDAVSGQLEPYQALRLGQKPGPGAVWRDVTEAVRADYLEDRQFGAPGLRFADYARQRGYDVREAGGVARIGAWSNPRAKWERWEIGGGYAGRLRVVWRDEPVDQARFGDLDFAAMRGDIRRAADRAYVAARRNPSEAAALGVDLGLSQAEHTLRRLRRHPLLTPALLKEGRWYEMAGDAQRALSADAWARTFEELVADTPTTGLVTVVDCRL